MGRFKNSIPKINTQNELSQSLIPYVKKVSNARNNNDNTKAMQNPLLKFFVKIVAPKKQPEKDNVIHNKSNEDKRCKKIMAMESHKEQLGEKFNFGFLKKVQPFFD